MSMSELVKIIETNGKGVRAYVECGRAARKNVATSSQNAASYFMLSIAADRFVETYDDQPLLSQKAEDEYLHFKNYVAQIEQAQADGTDEAMLKALNDIAAQIASHEFYRSDI